jgi:chromosomal replication initiator protein
MRRRSKQEVVMEDSEDARAITAQLAARIGRQRFNLWFNTQAALIVRGNLLSVRSANTFVRDWLRAHFADEIQAYWNEHTLGVGTVEFDVVPPAAQPITDVPAVNEVAAADLAQTSVEQPVKTATIEQFVAASAEALIDPPSRRSTTTLAGFVVGANNEYAFRAAELTARGRQQASPLVFFGPSGVGKTHLLRAIVQEYRRHNHGASALYLSAEQFTSSFVEAVRGSGMPSFRQKCRGVRLLAIDDLHFFPGKRRTLEELQYTLDAAAADGKQVVLASDRSLSEMHSLGPELKSRLSAGLVCEMLPPEFTTRKGILKKLAGDIGIDLSDELITLVATQIAGTARELQGALNRLYAMSATFKQPISRELVERALADIARHNTRPVRLADVQKVVCDAFGVEPVQLRSDRKSRAVAEPRMIAMWLARKYTRAPWSEIGEFFGRSSHSTVISAHRRIEKLIAQQGQIGMADRPCAVDDAIRRLEAALRTA